MGGMALTMAFQAGRSLTRVTSSLMFCLGGGGCSSGGCLCFQAAPEPLDLGRSGRMGLGGECVHPSGVGVV